MIRKPTLAKQGEVTTYRVTGSQPVYFTAPGETFTATLTPAQQYLLEWGHIELVAETDDARGDDGDTGDTSNPDAVSASDKED